ncbi:MAG: glycosyltransferase family 2 protein [Treponema sp.]|nr:glycosyltransferase family 2 protein [Treponema sp.]
MFSIVIPTYKRDQDLTECLESIRANTSLPVEILVLHGGFDSTREICEKYGAVSMLDHARENGKRVRGLWAIINEGIRAAKYDYVMYLNDDCLVLPDWDKIAASYFYKNDRLGILVLKSKGIGQVQEFRVVHQANGLPCANYAILNKKTNSYFDEKYNWFYGDPDIVCEIAAHTDYDIEETSENMVIHNHKLDETRVSNENKKQELIDSTYFEKKWCFYKVSESNALKLVKKNIIAALYKYFKISLKFMLDLIKMNKSSIKE